MNKELNENANDLHSSFSEASFRQKVCMCIQRRWKEVPTVSSYNSVKILIRERFACRQMATCSLESFPTQELQSRHKLFLFLSHAKYILLSSRHIICITIILNIYARVCVHLYVCVCAHAHARALTEPTRDQWIPRSRGYRHFWATWCKPWDLNCSLP